MRELLNELKNGDANEEVDTPQRYYRNWWSRHNYLLSWALDAGLAYMGVFLYLCLGMEHISLEWWGSDADGCPLASCPPVKELQ